MSNNTNALEKQSEKHLWQLLVEIFKNVFSSKIFRGSWNSQQQSNLFPGSMAVLAEF